MPAWGACMTQRQFEAWQAWLNTEDERITLDHHYMMQVAQEAFRLNFILNAPEDRPNIELSQFRLKFRRVKASTSEGSVAPQAVPATPQPTATDDEARRRESRMHAARWGARLGATRKSAGQNKKEG